MKRIFFISIVLVIVIFFGLETTSTARRNQGNGTAIAYIHYQVVIHPDYRISNNQCSMVVEITNEAKTIVGMPQQYIHGVNIYNFYELGPIYGTRVASLTNTASGRNDVCYAVTITGTRTGNFDGGQTYPYELWGTNPNQLPAPADQ
jgi:hypothetical protein